MNSDKLKQRLQHEVNAWFEETPQRPIADFMLDVIQKNVKSHTDKSISLLRQCEQIVDALNKAEHMLDGFGTRSNKPSDTLAERLKKFLADNQELS